MVLVKETSAVHSGEAYQVQGPMDTSVKSRMWDDIIPVMAVKDNVMISRRGDLTLGWELTLPPAFSMMEDEYDAVTMRLYEAVRKVQPWTIIHRQDVYTDRKSVV